MTIKKKNTNKKQITKINYKNKLKTVLGPIGGV